MIVYGTRPERLKLQSVIEALKLPDGALRVVFTGQHRELADPYPASPFFEHLSAPDPEAPLNVKLAAMIAALDHALKRHTPQLVLVQGDTSSALAGALSAFHRGVEVAHLEAGLRTPSIRSPFPEEANRRLITTLSSWHYAPTEAAASNLRREGVQGDRVLVVGNTSVDRLRAQLERLGEEAPRRDDATIRVLMTLHRRELLPHLDALLQGMAALLERHPEVEVRWPRHPHPRIIEAAEARLGAHPGVVLTGALPHDECVSALCQSDLVWTDSGGLQEEAVTLGIPTVVLRGHTDRPEGLAEGRITLSGEGVEAMLSAMERSLLSAPKRFEPCELYGRGEAGRLVAEHLTLLLEASSRSAP